MRYQALPPRRPVFSSVSASVFLSVFQGTTTRLTPILITRRHHRPTITRRPPVLHPRPRINHPPRIRPGLAMGLRNRRRHRQSPTRRGRDGPTHKVNSAASTNGPRAPVGTPPEDTGPPVETPTASGASSTDSPHHEHSGADGAGVRVPPRLLKINANFPWSGLGCVVNCIVNAKAAMAWQPIGIDRSSPAG